MSDAVVEDVRSLLRRRYGQPVQVGRSNRLWTFGQCLTCSINYSKVLSGHRFFFGLSSEVADKGFTYPKTDCGDFVLLACGSSREVLVLPRHIILEMLNGVATRKLDVFREDKTYILQTTKHPKLNITEFLNAYPVAQVNPGGLADDDSDVPKTDRAHVKFQSALIDLGQAEGCSVWVPPGDRSLSYRGRSFIERTIDRLPNFGFEENTRRIVQNIDVLWLTKNVIRKAFEVESSTVIYSGLLRLNDLVLAQPNNRIDLYIAASRSRREKVLNQLIRPSFHALISECEFFAFEEIEDQLKKIEGVPINRGVRITGLVKGERFSLPEHFVYPAGV
jgi:hypothetical protein